MASSSSQAGQKKNTNPKKMQRKEGDYLSFLASIFGMKRSYFILFFTFLQHWALHVPAMWSFALSSPSSFNVELCTFLKPCVMKLCGAKVREFYWTLKMEWAGNEVREVGRRVRFWAREGGWKIPGQGKRMGFWFICKTAWMASYSTALVAAGPLQLAERSPKDEEFVNSSRQSEAPECGNCKG